MRTTGTEEESNKHRKIERIGYRSDCPRVIDKPAFSGSLKKSCCIRLNLAVCSRVVGLFFLREQELRSVDRHDEK